MKLYIANGRYVGTQAQARDIDPKHNLQHVEVRTDKDGLIEDLNAIVAAASRIPHFTPGEPIAVQYNSIDPDNGFALFQSTPPVAPVAIEKARDFAAQTAQDITIEEAIGDADYPRALSLAHHIHHRLMEFARAAGGAA